MQRSFLLLFWLSVTAILSGCKDTDVPCRTSVVDSELTGNAGCWVVVDSKLLMVKQLSGKYSFPGGTSETGESAQCTAHRETWEETGINVLVGDLKRTFDNGFYLFDCTADNAEGEVRDWKEVVDVVWVDPRDIPVNQWRFPSQRTMAIEWGAE